MSKKFTNANIAQRLAEKQKELQLQRDKTQLSAQSAKQQVTPVNTRFAVLKVNKPKKEAVKTESSTPSLATANVWQTDKEVESSNTPAKRAGVSGEPSWGDESEEMDFSEPLPGMHRNGEQTKTTISTQNTEPEHVVKQESVNTTPAIEPVESQTITNTDTPKPVPEALTEVSSNSQDFQSPQPYFSPHNAPVLVPVFVPPGKEEFPPYEPEGDEASSTSSFSTDIDRALEQNDSPQRHAKPTPADNSRTSNTDTKSTVFHSVHPSPPFKVLLRRAQPPPPDPTPLPMPAQVSTEVSSPVKIAARRPHNIHDPSIQPVAPPRNLGSVVENPHQAPSHFDNERTENRRRRGERDKERAEPKQYPKPAPQFYTGQPIQIMSREPDSKQKDMQAPINNNIQWSRPTPPPPDTTFFSSQPPPTEASKNPNKEGNNRRKGRGRGGKEDFKQSQPSGHNPQAHTHDGSSSEEEQTNRLPSRRRNKTKTGENPNGRNKPTPDHWQHDDRSPQKFEEENRRYVGPEVPSRGKKHKERPTPVDWEGFRTGSGWNQEQITRQEQGQRQETRHENSFRQDHYQRQDRQEHTQRHERQEYVRQEQSYRQDQRHETNPARHEQTHRQDNYKQEQVHKEKVQRQDQGHPEHQNQKKSNQTETPKESDRNQGRHNSEKQEQNANRNRDNRNTDNKHNRDKRKDTRHADEGQGHQRYDRYYENEPEQPRKWVQKSKT